MPIRLKLSEWKTFFDDMANDRTSKTHLAKMRDASTLQQQMQDHLECVSEILKAGALPEEDAQRDIAMMLRGALTLACAHRAEIMNDTSFADAAELISFAHAYLHSRIVDAVLREKLSRMLSGLRAHQEGAPGSDKPSDLKN